MKYKASRVFYFLATMLWCVRFITYPEDPLWPSLSVPIIFVKMIVILYLLETVEKLKGEKS